MIIGGAKTNERKPKYNKIPLCAMRRLARRFEDGEAYDDPAELGKLNGAMNWQGGTEAFWTERYNHAIEHLMLSRFDDSEDHLAAVAWYCFCRMFYEETGRKETTGRLSSAETSLPPLSSDRPPAPESAVAALPPAAPSQWAAQS